MNGRTWSEEGERARFRPTYRQLSDDEKALGDAIKTKATELAVLYQTVKDSLPGRAKALAFAKLEESVMWAIKELTG